jgi:hypothetical protein
MWVPFGFYLVFAKKPNNPKLNPIFQYRFASAATMEDNQLNYWYVGETMSKAAF